MDEMKLLAFDDVSFGYRDGAARHRRSRLESGAMAHAPSLSAEGEAAQIARTGHSSVPSGNGWRELPLEDAESGLLFYQLSLSIAPGEMVGLLGPNGSGKTTLIKLAAGVLQPQAGCVLLGGRDVRTLPRREIARRVAVVPQELTMPFAFTVRQMVALGRTPHLGLLGVERAHDRQAIAEALATTGTAALVDRVFSELSGGERQRVIVALALAQEPELLLLDEPTAHLDIKHQVEVLELVRRLNRMRNVTVLATMHDLNLAARYFDRLILLQRGIVADGTPAQVLDAELLSQVYDTPVQVGILRATEHISVLPPGPGAPLTTLASSQPHRFSCSGPLVHVFGGGGSAELIMRALADTGIPFSAGAFTIGDSDEVLAQRLAARVVREEPCSAIAPARLAEVRACLAAVRAQILAPAPIGYGNLALLRVALEAARSGLPTYMLINREHAQADDCATLAAVFMAGHDSTGGLGTALAAELLVSGAQPVGDLRTLIARILAHCGDGQQE
jgi:iron complex transport system ATP-binding protein